MCRDLLIADHGLIAHSTLSHYLSGVLMNRLLQVWTGRPARGLVSQVTADLQQTQEQLPLSLYGIVSAAACHYNAPSQCLHLDRM